MFREFTYWISRLISIYVFKNGIKRGESIEREHIVDTIMNIDAYSRTDKEFHDEIVSFARSLINE